MRTQLLILALSVSGCGSKKESKDKPSPTPGAPSTPAAGGFQRVNGLITNSEGAVLCAALLPESLRAGFKTAGGGAEDRLTCNLKGDKVLHSAAIDCKKGQSLDAFKADKSGKKMAEVPGLGRAAFQDAMGPVFYATKVECAVTLSGNDPTVDLIAFGKGVDDVLTPTTTPWPPK